MEDTTEEIDIAAIKKAYGNALYHVLGKPSTAPEWKAMEAHIDALARLLASPTTPTATISAIKSLLNMRSDQSGGGETILYEACRVGHASLVQTLLNLTASSTDGTALIDVNMTVRATTPLMAAITAATTVSSSQSSSQSTQSPQSLSSSHNNAHNIIVRALVDHPETDLNQADDDESGVSPLMMALINRNAQAALHLLQARPPTRIIPSLLLPPSVGGQDDQSCYDTCLYRACMAVSPTHDNQPSWDDTVKSPPQNADDMKDMENVANVIIELLNDHFAASTHTATVDSATAIGQVKKTVNARCSTLLGSISAAGGAKANTATTALHTAIRRRNVGLVKALLQCPAIDVNQTNSDGITPLMQAVALQQRGFVKLLLNDSRTNPNISTPSGNTTAVIIAATQGLDAIVEEFVKAHVSGKASINWNEMRGGETPLRVAAGKGHLAVVKLLLKYGSSSSSSSQQEPIVSVDINAPDSIFSMSPLAVASEQNHIHVVRALLDVPRAMGLDVNQRSFGGRTALHLALLGHHSSVVRMLIDDSRTDINAVISATGASPLWLAAHKGDYELCTQLLARDDVQLDSAVQGATSFWIACQEGHLPILELLVPKIRKMEQQQAYQVKQKQHDAALPASPAHASILVRKNDRGASALHVACAKNHEAVVRYLLDAVPELDVRDKADRTTILLEAAARDRDSIVMLLLERRPQEMAEIVNEPLVAGKTALWLATTKESVRVVSALLKVPTIDVNAADDDNGWTALHLATLKKNYELVTVLLQASKPARALSGLPTVDPNIVDKTGFAPLDLAVHARDVELIKVLLRHRSVKLTKVSHTLASQLAAESIGGGDSAPHPIVALLNAREKKDRQVAAQLRQERELAANSDGSTPLSTGFGVGVLALLGVGAYAAYRTFKGGD
jgi:ankyrin repeat protein